MNKKGFTLVELLVTIVLIGLLFALAVPGINKIRNNIEKKKEAKVISLAESSAVLWGQDNKTRLRTFDCAIDGKTKKCNKITIGELIAQDYYDLDTDKYNEKCIYVYKENNRVHAKYVNSDDKCNNNITFTEKEFILKIDGNVINNIHFPFWGSNYTEQIYYRTCDGTLDFYYTTTCEFPEIYPTYATNEVYQQVDIDKNTIKSNINNYLKDNVSIYYFDSNSGDYKNGNINDYLFNDNDINILVKYYDNNVKTNICGEYYSEINLNVNKNTINKLSNNSIFNYSDVQVFLSPLHTEPETPLYTNSFNNYWYEENCPNNDYYDCGAPIRKPEFDSDGSEWWYDPCTGDYYDWGDNNDCGPDDECEW